LNVAQVGELHGLVRERDALGVPAVVSGKPCPACQAEDAALRPGTASGLRSELDIARVAGVNDAEAVGS
jgi:hypothetical protein